MTSRKPKKRKCSECPTMINQINSLHVVCGFNCSLKRVVRLNKRKTDASINKQRNVERAELRARKKVLKSKSDWLREAQTACNAYIRERDRKNGEGCISCGTQKDVQYCAGHFKTRGGHPELRFHPFNINLQCNKNCNLHLSGNIAEYRPRLIDKIGLKNVEWLEGKHEPQNLAIEDIKEIKQYYKGQLKLLLNAS